MSEHKKAFRSARVIRLSRQFWQLSAVSLIIGNLASECLAVWYDDIGLWLLTAALAAGGLAFGYQAFHIHRLRLVTV